MPKRVSCRNGHARTHVTITFNNIMNTNEGQHISWSRLYKFACVRRWRRGAIFRRTRAHTYRQPVLIRFVSTTAARCRRICRHVWASFCASCRALIAAALNGVIDLYGSHLFAGMRAATDWPGKKVRDSAPGHLTRKHGTARHSRTHNGRGHIGQSTYTIYDGPHMYWLHYAWESGREWYHQDIKAKP